MIIRPDCKNCLVLLPTPSVKPSKIVVIDGPQGSGKTTVAAMVADRLGAGVTRGFPTGSEIAAANGDQTELCKNAFLRTATAAPGEKGVAVVERSPISQSAFLLRSGKKADALACLANRLGQVAEVAPTDVVMLDSQPGLCLQRQDTTTSLSIRDLAEQEKEVGVYRQIATELKRNPVPGVRTLSMFNGPKTNIETIVSNIISFSKK